jgi:hypothetical protein
VGVRVINVRRTESAACLFLGAVADWARRSSRTLATKTSDCFVGRTAGMQGGGEHVPFMSDI